MKKKGKERIKIILQLIGILLLLSLFLTVIFAFLTEDLAGSVFIGTAIPGFLGIITLFHIEWDKIK